MTPVLTRKKKDKSKFGGTKQGENSSSPVPREPRSVRFAASTTTVLGRPQQQQQQQQHPRLQHSGMPVQHPIVAPPLGAHGQQSVSEMVSTPQSQVCRPISATLAESAAAAWAADVPGEAGGGSGNREGNGAEALQIEQPHQSLINQLPIPSQSLNARQMVSQSIALPSATARWQPQQLQQQQLESNPQTQQQQPRVMNLADGGYSAGENEEAIHYGRGFEEYRNNLLGGAQARGRRSESYSEDGVLTDKKRGRRQGPETSAFDRRKGGGRSGANSKRCKASRREAGQGERSRGSCSPTRSDSRPRRSNPDGANAPSAAEPESPDPSQLAVSRQPLALSADLVSPVASWTFQKGEAVRHRRTADYAGAPAVAAGTASTTAASAALGTQTAGAAETAAAPHMSVPDTTPPALPLRLHPFPRSSAAGEATTAWASTPSPRRPTRVKSSRRGCSSKKAKASKRAVEPDVGNSGAGEGKGAGAGGDPYLSPTLAANSEAKLALYSSASLRRVTAADDVLSDLTDLLRSKASVGSTLAQQLSLVAMEAKERALRLQLEAARAQREAANAVRLATAEIMRAEACALVDSTTADVAASNASGEKVSATAGFTVFASGKEPGDREGNGERDVLKRDAGNYAVSDDSEPEVGEETGDYGPSENSYPADGDHCDLGAESPRFSEALPPGPAALTVDRVSTHRGASRTPANVNYASMKLETPTPPGRYDVSSSEAATSDCGPSPMGGDAENAWNSGTPTNRQGDGPVPSPPAVSKNRFDVSSSEGTDSVRCASPRGADIGNAKAGRTPTVAEGIYGRASFHTTVASRYNVSSSDEDENVDRSERKALGKRIKGEGRENGLREVELQTSPRGRYDVSSSSSAATSNQEDSDDDGGNGFDGGGSLGGLKTPKLTPLLSPPPPLSSQSLGRYDVSSSSSSDKGDEDDAAASTAPVDTPFSPPYTYGRYDVSSSSSGNGDGYGRRESTSGDEQEWQLKQQREQRKRLKRQQKQRLRRHRRRESSLAPRPSPPPPPTPLEAEQEREQEQEQECKAPLESSPSDSRSVDSSGFDSDAYKRFYAPKFPGSGGRFESGACWGLGLPHPLGLEVGLPSSKRSDCKEGRGGNESDSASSNDEVVRITSRAERGRAASPAVVVPSGAEFEWGKVNPESPLKLHKSLLDRLAGIGTPLPPLPGMPPLVGDPRSPPPPTVAATAASIPGPVPPTPMEEDGNSSENSLETNSDKNQDRSKSTEKSRLDGAGASAPPSQQAVVDVDRESGNQHWGEIMNAASMPPIELDPAKRSRSDDGGGGGGGGESKPSGGGGDGGHSGGARAPLVEPPLPMRDDPDGSGEKVLDHEAHARMFPGGAVMTMKGLNLKDKSAVSAAFELCAAMEPKSRPKFEHKDGNKSNTSPFTLHVSVNGVNYTPATAKSVKLAKQLAAVNFLRESVGTRERIKLEELSTDAGGGATANAALAAAVGKIKGSKSKAKEGDGEDGEDDGDEDILVVNKAEAARLALDDGLPNHAQLLHDLAAAHPETPSFATYAYRTVKDLSSGSSSKSGSSGGNRAKTFRCTARIIKHSIDVAEVARRREEEKEAKAAENAARAALSADPSNQKLLQEIEKARADISQARPAPVLNIEMLSAVGDGASKKEAKHKAAEAMAYKLLPECKTDAELRKRTKKIIDVYQKEKKERVEEEQRIAQEAKALREKTKAAVEVPEPPEPLGPLEPLRPLEPPEPNHFGRNMKNAVIAAKRRNSSDGDSAAEGAPSAGGEAGASAGASAVDNEPPEQDGAHAASAGDRGSPDTPPMAAGASASVNHAALAPTASPGDYPVSLDYTPHSPDAKAASDAEATSNAEATSDACGS